MRYLQGRLRIAVWTLRTLDAAARKENPPTQRFEFPAVAG